MNSIYLNFPGTPLMPLDSYPFSKMYGWIQDKYGFSWQLILPQEEGDWRPSLAPSLLFVGNKWGKAEEAINFYTSIFESSKRGMTVRYPAGQEPNKEDTIMYADFTVNGQYFAAMGSALEHKFTFNEATSFMVLCKKSERNRLFLGKSVFRSRIRTMRLAQRQVRRLLANCTSKPG